MVDGDAPSDRLRDRTEESRLKLWFLLEADRWFVTAIMVAVVFVTLGATGYLLPAAQQTIRTTDTVGTLFQALLTATITGVTLVLTLNQLVLSQELGAVKDQRERMTGAMAFREDVADAVGAPVSPARPAQFLRALVQAAAERAETVREAVDEDSELATAVDDLAGSLIGNADTVSAGLDDARFGRFAVISSALNFNYSWKVFAARRIRATYADDLDDETAGTLDELIDVLELFGPAREHFKTLYFQWALINLSRSILAASVPALLVSAGMILFFDPAVTLRAFGVDWNVAVIVAAVTVAVVPFLILLAYVVRIATVTKHTLSIGPFILRETDQVTEVEWGP